MSARTCADCGHRLDIHTPDGCVALHLDGSLCACPTPTPERPVSGETTYPCDDCGTMRTKAEGGTTFTVCDACWDRLYRKSPTPPSRERGEEAPPSDAHSGRKSGDPCDCTVTWPEVARLTRELAEARAENARAAEEGFKIAAQQSAALDAARAEAARLREAWQPIADSLRERGFMIRTAGRELTAEELAPNPRRSWSIPEPMLDKFTRALGGTDA